MVKQISAIADECVCIDPIQTAQQQVIRVHQIITNCWKMTCQVHKHHTFTFASILMMLLLGH